MKTTTITPTKKHRARSPRPIDSPNKFEEDFGKHLTENQLSRMSEELKSFMSEIRVVLRATNTGIKGAGCNHTEPQRGSCAFNPATDNWNGAMYSAYGLLWALHHDKIFLCHASQPNWEQNKVDLTKIQLCRGFKSVITMNPNASVALADVVMERLREIANQNY